MALLALAAQRAAEDGCCQELKEAGSRQREQLLSSDLQWSKARDPLLAPREVAQRADAPHGSGSFLGGTRDASR